MSDFVTTQRHVVTLANGDRVPALGQGTWYLGDSRSTHDREAQALRAGVASGMTLIDTAEMYGNGRSERLVGDALDGVVVEGGQLREADGTRAKTLDRDELFIVSKVLPSNAGEPDIFDSCDETLENLGVDYLDLYLLHWRGMVPLSETVACMEELIAEGKIRAWGVSNFDTDDMEDLWRVPGGQNCQVNQVLYHPGSRGIEFDLLPWMRDHGVALMAYCPLAQAGTLRGRLFRSPELAEVARRHNVTVPQVILAWDIRGGDTIAIPRSSRPEHTLENAAADAIELTEDDLALISRAFPAPSYKMPLDME